MELLLKVGRVVQEATSGEGPWAEPGVSSVTKTLIIGYKTGRNVGLAVLPDKG